VKKIKVKDLAQKFGVSPKEILKELESEGIEASSASSFIPADMLELIEEHFEDLYDTDEKKAKKKAKKAEDDLAIKQEAATATSVREVHLKTPIVVKNLAEIVGKRPNIVISDLMSMGILAAINQTVDQDTAEALCEKYGLTLVLDRREKTIRQTATGRKAESDFIDNPDDLIQRPPVVTFLGHVDHGKTSLQDKIRNTKVVKGEAGGITQHIGASVIEHEGKKITFIDTPGHEAFSQMRARGADMTDIAILVVAADDGFKPQTVEAMKHAQEAKVPIIVAMNKMDLPDANPDKVLLHMQQNSLMSEDWGGDVGTVRVSAETGQGLDELLHRIILEAEMLELKANPKRPAEGVVIESQIEQGFGPTAHVLIQNGTLRVGDAVLSDEYFGRVKSMIDEHGKRIMEAGPSTPVKLVGLSGAPCAGEVLRVFESEKEARLASEARRHEKRSENLAVASSSSLEDLFDQMSNATANANSLKVMIKSDVRGSGEAIADSLTKLPDEKIKVDIVSNGVGAITENDVMLASASGSVIVGFHVRVNPGVNALAKKEKVEIRLYSIIYELIEDIIEALEGRLAPDKRERSLGKAKILQIFSVSKGPKICGCIIEQGSVKIGSKARVFRDGELIFNGDVKSLRRFQDDVKEVKATMECGIRLDNFMDFEENDVIEFYEVEFSKASL
jgi:translation initiation factor IF-2